MERINKSDTALAAIRIHLAGVAFYRTAFEKDPTAENHTVYLTVAEMAIKQIDEIVNGKAKG